MNLAYVRVSSKDKIKRFGDYYLNINAIPSPILCEILSMLAI